MRATDCVVVGAGPAGLAASSALTTRGVDHLVLDRGRAGQSWLSQRWDAFRLNTPGWMNTTLGAQPDDCYATRKEVVALLADRAAQAPVREAVPVTRLRPTHSGFALQTGDGAIQAWTAVAATGDQNVPRRPALSSQLPGRIFQCHAADYRNPHALPDGVVLVVGSGQSGCQIADDLLGAGRRVLLSTSPVGRVPTPYRDRDTVRWLVDAGFLDQRPDQVADPSVLHQAQPVIGPGGRPMSLQGLAGSGATLLGRLIEATGERLRFDDSAAANMAAADAAADRMCAIMDDLIRRTGTSAPPAPSRRPSRPVPLDSPTRIDLRAADVSTVVWCTGFTGDFCWLDPSLLDPDGQPRRDGPAAPVPGLWYLGLNWLTRRGSGLLYGMPGDAAAVADSVRLRLGDQRRPPRQLRSEVLR